MRTMHNQFSFTVYLFGHTHTHTERGKQNIGGDVDRSCRCGGKKEEKACGTRPSHHSKKRSAVAEDSPEEQRAGQGRRSERSRQEATAVRDVYYSSPAKESGQELTEQAAGGAPPATAGPD